MVVSCSCTSTSPIVILQSELLGRYKEHTTSCSRYTFVEKLLYALIWLDGVNVCSDCFVEGILI